MSKIIIVEEGSSMARDVNDYLEYLEKNEPWKLPMKGKVATHPGCKCAKYDDNGRYECSVSGSGCVFMIPNSKRCAELYGEGPDVPMTEDEQKNVIQDWFFYRDCMIHRTMNDLIINYNLNNIIFQTNDESWYVCVGKIFNQNGMDCDGDYRHKLVESPEQKMLDEKLDELLEGQQ